MVESVFEYLFKQGLGYVLFLGSLLINGYLLKKLLDEKEKRLQDAKDNGKTAADTEKEHFIALDNFRKTMDAIVTILNSRKP